ncbi:hypothetical protein [Thiolapillus sp.]|uniref:hypothetical protein n=1 Tax=Thiolapillus sp. TaxID=2017437 RepID=UPI003AF86878
MRKSKIQWMILVYVLLAAQSAWAYKVETHVRFSQQAATCSVLADPAFMERLGLDGQACLRPRDRFWDIPVPKIDSAFDNLFVPQPSWSPSTTQQLRKLVAAPYLTPI